MFIELTQHKLMIVMLAIIAIVGSLALFLAADGSFALIAHAEEYGAMEQSDFWYWLIYQLPSGDNAAYAAAEMPAGSAQSVPVLLYHGEGATSDMPLSIFVDQLRALKSAGWQTITMQQFEDFIQHGTPLPAKSFLLTFDDGRKDTYYQADPVLKDLGYNAVMFVITGFSLPDTGGKDSTFYLNKTELQGMVASGRWQLESHGDEDHATYAVQSTTDLTQTASTTDGHFLSNKFWSTTANRFETDAEFTARASNDLSASKQTLEGDFNISVNAFAYPFNDFGQDTVNFPGSEQILQTVVPSVYSFAFYQTWPDNGDTFDYPLVANGPDGENFMVKRIEPSPTWSGNDLLAALEAGEAKPLPYTTSRFGAEWQGTWGNTSATDSGFSLAAAAQTSGASAFLNGSRWWSNYFESATITNQVGAASLIARNTDDANYLTCTFDASGISIETHSAASHTTLASLSNALPSGTHTLGMAVWGNQVTCYENGTPLVSATAPQASSSGGIGIEIWDQTLGTASATLSRVAVEALSTAPPSPRAPVQTASAAASVVRTSVPATSSTTVPRLTSNPIPTIPLPTGTTTTPIPNTPVIPIVPTSTPPLLLPNATSTDPAPHVATSTHPRRGGGRVRTHN